MNTFLLSPISVLPCPKEEIEGAIKEYLVFLSLNKQLTEKNRAQLTLCFSWLSRFVNDDAVKIGADNYDMITTIKGTTQNLDVTLKQKPELQRYFIILGVANDQMQRKHAEIEQFIDNLIINKNEIMEQKLYSQENVSKAISATIFRILLAPFKFVSNLFQPPFLMKVQITFFNLYGPDDHFVNYETSKYISEPTVRDFSQFFALYYSKTLYNMARNQNCSVLIDIMRDISSGDFRERKSKIAMHINNRMIELSKPELLQKLKTMEKKYTGYLRGDKDEVEQRYITIDIAFGAENYYLPLSVLVFLEDLANKMDTNDIVALYTCVQGMNDYFKKHGYNKLSDINESVLEGLAQSGLIAKKLF